jgi:hypothetical protein
MKRRDIRINFGRWVANIDLAEKFYLPDFSRVFKLGIIIRKYIRAVGPGRFIQGSAAALVQDYRFGGFDSRKIRRIGRPPGADDICVGFKYGMKRDNHFGYVSPEIKWMKIFSQG